MSVLVFLFLLLAPAQASTLAVLPLDKATASEEYDGLGKAVASMLVTDLSKVPGLELVERDRLQALMDEMKLSETGFLDESTAQKLGSGLGAKFVVLGTYSVVKETFILDARVVEVSSGTIRKAAGATGAVDDFVTVEKDLVEALVDGLDVELSSSVRRQMLIDAPTEDFSAFSAWGEGIQRQDEGDLDAARAAFERALTKDPEFAAAQASLSEVRALLEAYKSERLEAYHAVYGEMNKGLLDAFGDERERALDVPDDMDMLVGFALRLAALENEGRHCQRYAEMVHYLERNDWQVSEPARREGPDAEGRDPGVFSYELRHEAEDRGFTRYSNDADGPEIASSSLSSRYSGRFDSTGEFLFGQKFYEVVRNDASSALFASLDGCYPPAERLAEIERMHAELGDAGLLDEVHLNDAGVTLEDYLDLYWAYTHARWIGAGPELTRRTERLLRRVKVDPTKATEDEAARERFVVQHIEFIVRDAGNVQKWKSQRGGLSVDEANRLARALVAEDTTVFDATPPMCTWSVDHATSLASNYLHGIEDLEPNDWMLINMRAGSGVSWYSVLERSGCVVGVDPEFEDLGAVMDFIRVAISSYERGTSGTCDSYVRGLEQIARSLDGMPAGAPVGGDFESIQSFNLLNFYGMSEAESCW